MADLYDEQGNPVAAPAVIDPSQVVQGEGRIAMVRPDGTGVTIPTSSLQQALAAGYRTEAPQAHEERQREQEYGSSPLSAGLEGAARGATFGLSDAVLKEFSTNYALPEADRVSGVEQRKERNPLAAGVGEVAGFLGTAGTTGLGEAAGLAGKAAFGGSGILGRAGAAAVRSGIEGAAMGAGQGISDVALSKDPMTAEAIVGSIGHHVLVGGTIGAVSGGALSLGASGLDSAIGAAGKVVRKAADKFHGELGDEADALSTATPELRNEVMAMSKPDLAAAQKAEQATVESVQTEQAKAFAQDTGDFYRATRNDLFKLRQQLPDKQLKKVAIRASAKLEGVVGNLEGLATEPGLALEPLQRMGQQIEEMQRYLPDATLTPISEQINALKTRAIDLMGDATSPRLEAISARLDQIANPAETPLIDGALKGAGAAVGGAIGHATGIPYAGIAGAWLGKELSETIQPLARKVLGSFVQHAGAIEDGASKLFAKITPPQAALDVLKDFAAAAPVAGESHYETATKAITAAAANPQQTLGQMQQQLAGLHAAAPQLAEQVAQGLQLKVNFLASKVSPQVSMGLSGQLIPPTHDEEATFARYVAAAQDPLRLLKELRAGTLMPETVETHEALYPQIKQRIEAALTTHLADADVAKRVPYDMRLQLSMLLGPQVDATLAPDFVALMQQSFQQQGKPVKAGTTTDQTPPDVTAAQRLTSR